MSQKCSYLREASILNLPDLAFELLEQLLPDPLPTPPLAKKGLHGSIYRIFTALSLFFYSYGMFSIFTYFNLCDDKY